MLAAVAGCGAARWREESIKKLSSFIHHAQLMFYQNLVGKETRYIKNASYSLSVYSRL